MKISIENLSKTYPNGTEALSMEFVKSFAAVLLLLVFGYTSRTVSAGELKAGVSVINITPPVGVAHTAYGIGGGIHLNKGINDSTYAKILALTDGTERITIITLDLLGFVPDGVRKLLPGYLQNTIFCATHNHMGAATIAFTPPNFIYRTDYLTEIEENIAASIIEAHENMTLVTVGAATGSVDLSYNKLGGGLGLFLCGQKIPTA